MMSGAPKKGVLKALRGPWVKTPARPKIEFRVPREVEISGSPLGGPRRALGPWRSCKPAVFLLFFALFMFEKSRRCQGLTQRAFKKAAGASGAGFGPRRFVLVPGLHTVGGALMSIGFGASQRIPYGASP